MNFIASRENHPVRDKVTLVRATFLGEGDIECRSKADS